MGHLTPGETSGSLSHAFYELLRSQQRTCFCLLNRKPPLSKWILRVHELGHPRPRKPQEESPCYWQQEDRLHRIKHRRSGFHSTPPHRKIQDNNILLRLLHMHNTIRFWASNFAALVEVLHAWGSTEAMCQQAPFCISYTLLQLDEHNSDRSSWSQPVLHSSVKNQSLSVALLAGLISTLQKPKGGEVTMSSVMHLLDSKLERYGNSADANGCVWLLLDGTFSKAPAAAAVGFPAATSSKRQLYQFQENSVKKSANC